MQGVIKAALDFPRLKVLQVLHNGDGSSNAKLDIPESILQGLHERKTSGLKYVALDDDIVYQVLDMQPRQFRKCGVAGFIRGSSLLEEKMFDWLDDCK